MSQTKYLVAMLLAIVKYCNAPFIAAIGAVVCHKNVAHGISHILSVSITDVTHFLTG